mgnify:CR=1 FL=1|tara:strand:+ start:21016 stop:21306 length:291 start_codon:yes stop_codon:yes gene_type:complete
MKKIILGIVFIFTVSFAFATNDVSEDFNKSKNTQVKNIVNNSVFYVDNVNGTCVYTLTVLYSFGGISYAETTTYTTDASSYGDCAAKAKAHYARLT